MFIPTSQFTFLQTIRRQHKKIACEFRRAYKESQYIQEIVNAGMGIDTHLKNWVFENGLREDQAGYNVRQGDHTALVIYKKGETITEIEAMNLLPLTTSLLDKVPGVFFAAISVLGPNATLKEHTHTRQHYVYHLLLEDLINGCCEMQCNGHKKELRNAGDEIMFDYSYRHSVKNHAQNRRINLMIDFLPCK
ncbi:hypothetical protein A3754_16045 [Alcanivorax sp. HI0083]|nr:hypothetical protein A3730_14345 [Alcanivorax sp. HI0044]KZZ24892.1 hypothetical protein A3754_16045 [Alcanivorax sp. HI0083]